MLSLGHLMLRPRCLESSGNKVQELWVNINVIDNRVRNE
jgi:hypothetical protein